MEKFSKRSRCKCQEMELKIPVSGTTHSSCYKNAGFSVFLISQVFATTFSIKNCSLFIKLFYKNSDFAPVALQMVGWLVAGIRPIVQG